MEWAKAEKTVETHRSSSGLSNFFGFLGQQSQIYIPPILGPPGFDVFREVCTDILRAEAVVLGSAGTANDALLVAEWFVSDPGGLGFRIDFS